MERDPISNRTTVTALLAAAILPAALLAACVGGGGSGSPSPSGGTPGPSTTPDPGAIELPANPDAVVILVRDEGGFVTSDWAFTRLPSIAVYADGRVIVQGAVPAVYPGPLVTPLLVSRIGLDRVRALLADAVPAGLTPVEPVYWPATSVADAPDTVFEIWSNGALARTSFGALGIDLATSATAAERAARAAAIAYRDGLPFAWGPDQGATPEGAYLPAAIRLVVRPYTNPSPDLPQQPVTWPLTADLATAGVPVVDGSPESGRCLVLSGDELAVVWPILGTANTLTPFESAGASFSVGVRQLLPHEEPVCP